MGKKIFWTMYAIATAVLILLGLLAAAHVNRVLSEYEQAQPERIVEEQIKRIEEACAKGTPEEAITFLLPKQAEYDAEIPEVKEYKEKLIHAKEWTYKVKTSGYHEKEQYFSLLADGEEVAILTVESIGEQIRLAILTMTDWQLKSVTSLITFTNYNYTVEIPKGYRVFINETCLSGAAEGNEEGWELYHVDTLYSEPEIRVENEFGEEVLYNIVENNVKAIVYQYQLSLPRNYTVYAGERKQSGDVRGDVCDYSIITTSEEIVLDDSYGNTMVYNGRDEIYTYDYEIQVPDNFSVLVNGTSGEAYQVEEKENSSYQGCMEYADMPKQVTYRFEHALKQPEITICDNLGRKVECKFDNYSFTVTKQTGEETIPEEISSQVDVLETAKMWSKLMSDDLEGSQRGFGTIRSHLVKGSYLYDVAYKWATNVDIKYTASHVLDDPPFTQERVTNFVRYTENLFSCDIHFMKHMDLTSRKLKVTDETNSTFYFLYCSEETDENSGRWCLLDIQEIIAE